MAHVSVTINGRQYRMACDDGQEHHLARLAHDLDQRITNLRGTFGEIGDMRLTVMAALILVDELSEARQRMHRIETEFSDLQHARAAAADRHRLTTVGQRSDATMDDASGSSGRSGLIDSCLTRPAPTLCCTLQFAG